MALYVKGIEFEYVPVNLNVGSGRADNPMDTISAGEHRKAQYAAVNPQQQVPALEWREDGQVRRLAQSMAIVEYLDERFATPPLLPHSAFLRARARQIAEVVNAGIQPLQNSGVLAHVASIGGDHIAWARHFIDKGLTGLERLVAETAGAHAIGDTLTIADMWILPQLYNAEQLGMDLTPMPTLRRIFATASEHPAAVASHPKRQPDAP